MKMPNINDVYQTNSDHLKANDIPAGKQVTVTIESIEVQEFEDDSGKKNKLVLFFKDKEKSLVLNKTNATTISHVLGDDSDAWIGKNIILFSTKVSFGDKMVDAIRVNMPLEEAEGDSPPF
jgi:hypothetical protein